MLIFGKRIYFLEFFELLASESYCVYFSAFRRLSSWDNLMDCVMILTSNTNGNRFMEVLFNRLVPQAFVVAGKD